MKTTVRKIIGVRELTRNMKTISRATKRGASFLVMRNTEPLFRIEPIADEKKQENIPAGKYTLKDLMGIRFRSGEKDLSKRIDEIVYGV